MAARCVRSLLETTKGHEIELVTAIDADPETFEVLAEIVPDDLSWLSDYSKEYRGCSKAWNDAYAQSTGDPVVFAADDLIFSEAWLDAALAHLEGFPGAWGLVGFNDGHWDGHELSTHYLMSRRFVDEVLGGQVAWEEYRHSFNDAETCERAKRAGRYAWAEDARVHHEHWLFGERPRDDTDTRTLGDHADSERIFKERQASGFA